MAACTRLEPGNPGGEPRNTVRGPEHTKTRQKGNAWKLTPLPRLILLRGTLGFRGGLPASTGVSFLPGPTNPRQNPFAAGPMRGHAPEQDKTDAILPGPGDLKSLPFGGGHPGWLWVI